SVGRSGDRRLLSVVHAQPAARGIVSTILRAVYLADSVEEAIAAQAEHPESSFVTPEGMLIGPAVIHTAREADARLREIRAELQVLVHDLTGTQRQLRERRVRLEEIGSEIGFLREQTDAADADITAAADRLMSFERDLAGLRTERELLELRTASVHDGAATWRARPAALPRAGNDGAPAPR